MIFPTNSNELLKLPKASFIMIVHVIFFPAKRKCAAKKILKKLTLKNYRRMIFKLPVVGVPDTAVSVGV